MDELYSVYDAKAQRFLPPFLAPNEMVAMRQMASMVMDSSSVFGMHAEDFTLFKLGGFEPVSGNITLETTPVEMVNGRVLQIRLGQADEEKPF